MGAVGLIAAAVWILVYRDPDAAGLSPEHQVYLAEGRTDKGLATAVQKMTLAEWGGLFAHRTTLSMILGFFGSGYLTWVFITWLPGYLIRRARPDLITLGA